MHLGQSPHHGRNVSLVLNLTTGLVSPQFHVKHDPTFGILQQEKIQSSWLQKAGLKASNKHINTQSEETEFPGQHHLMQHCTTTRAAQTEHEHERAK